MKVDEKNNPFIPLDPTEPTPHFYFVFVAPGENIFNGLHVYFVQPYDLKTSYLHALRELPYWVPHDLLAVFIHEQGTDIYTFYKTYNNRRKKDALFSDTE